MTAGFCGWMDARRGRDIDMLVKAHHRCLGSGGAAAMALWAACSGILNKRLHILGRMQRVRKYKNTHTHTPLLCSKSTRTEKLPRCMRKSTRKLRSGCLGYSAVASSVGSRPAEPRLKYRGSISCHVREPMSKANHSSSSPTRSLSLIA